ncbi:hypothetical protein GCM10027589_13120 [Actinocorallia lasiicapitis]
MGFGKDHTESINIGEHTMTIGYRVYSLRNIVRIQALDLKPERGIGKQVGRLALVLVVAFAGFQIANSTGQPALALVSVVLGGGIGYILVKRLIKAIRDTSTYAILIETNGTAVAVLGNKSAQEIERVYWALHKALEEGKAARININTFNIKGDQINQSNTGSGNAYGKLIDA